MTNDTPSATTRRKPTGRPVSKYGRKAHVVKFKYKTVDYQHKLDVIHQVADVGMSAFLDSYCVNAAASLRETTRKKVYAWMKQKDLIESMAAAPRTAQQKCFRERGTGTTLPVHEEEQLARWVHGMRKDGIPITYNMLQIMALETAIDVGLSEDEFKGGWHWIQGFKRRHGLTFRAKTRIGQDSNQDCADTLSAFSERVLLTAIANDVQVIYNADQTAVNYEYLPTKTLNAAKEDTVWVKCGGKTKERATAILLADSTGRKYPLFLVLKTTKSKVKEVVQENLTWRNGFGRRVWSEVEPLQDRLGCRIYGNPTAWWNSGMSLEFLRYHFGDRHDRTTKKPADVAWIRPLKAALRANWLVEIRRQLRNSKALKENLKLRGPSRPTMVSWITGVWKDLPGAVILNGFRKCQLIQGAIEECVEVDDALEDSELTDVAENMAIEDTIHPAGEIGLMNADNTAPIYSL
ncbi:hypothetical protein DYB38_009717 [Aphanomyces astaci]|uniref:HTH CENPB-type domain-containing protein n=1 Tax=Aphanomyces astaci TaxID=112090 RepID=A0A397CT50_APHAT|nr:hypothetical protein DYB38_009717 [Aphanomyces astaci]